MKRLIITKNGIITNKAEMEESELNSWFDYHKSINSFGIEGSYQYTISDISAEISQQQINETALKYLSETDWYVTRFTETGVVIPSEITEARQAARLSIAR